jgi:hypothetical protein
MPGRAKQRVQRQIMVPNMDEFKFVENYSGYSVLPEFQEGAYMLMKDSLQHT